MHLLDPTTTKASISTGPENMSNPDQTQEEHEHISTSLAIEQIDTNLFRSTSLWRPVRARSAFGGQVISQAVVSATNCTDPAFALHSLHCYFLLGANPSIPTIYYVDRLRTGRSYSTRSVRAVQQGKVIFIMMCSFHKPELRQPTHSWPMPRGAPPPEQCELEEARWTREAQTLTDERLKKAYLAFAAERTASPIAVSKAKEGWVMKDGTKCYMYWMQARDVSVQKYGAPFQKCILAYLSDLYFIPTAGLELGLQRWGQGPDALGMSSTLDHTIYFYDDKFDCGDALLYYMICPCAGDGRAVVHGRLYSRDGTLVAVTSQEGVVRRKHLLDSPPSEPSTSTTTSPPSAAGVTPKL